MRIVGFNFTKINAERTENSTEKLEIKSNIHIDSIDQSNEGVFKDGNTLSIKFEYSINYSPDIATILFGGIVIALTNEEETKTIMEKWNENKQIDDEARPLLFNTIFSRSNIKALEFEQELNLPPHIPLPRITKDSLKSPENTDQKDQ